MKKLLSPFLLTAFLSAFSPSAQALDFSAHGYYRLQTAVSNNLDLQKKGNIAQGLQGDNDRFGTLFYGQQRFRVEPALKISDNISFHATLDLLDDVVFGRNDTRNLSVFNPISGTLTLPGGNGAFGVTGGNGGDIVTGGGGNVNLRRLYVDWLTPIGKFRLGRQPSHWGLGIFQNDGNAWDGLFGDTFDRFAYLGKYDFKNSSSSLAFITLVDFAFQNTGNPAIDLLERKPGQPVLGAKHDTWQFTQAFFYQRPHLEVGSYAGLRLRNGTGKKIPNAAFDANGNITDGAIDGNTRTFYVDVYGKWQRDPITVKAEYVYVGGKIATGVCIDAVQVPAGFTNPLPQPVCLNGSNKVSGSNDLSVSMGALEVEGKHGKHEWKAISGFAQGDSSPLSSRISQFGFRSDYRIGLLMFNMPLGTSPAIQVNGETKLGNKPITSNFVNNAVYLGGTYKHQFDLSKLIPQAQWMKVGGHVVTAWAPSRTVNFDFAEITGQTGLPHVFNNSRWYGIEVDALAEARLFDHVFWNFSAGVLFPGGAYDIKDDNIANQGLKGNPINSIIFDPAEVAFAVRSTLSFEF